MTLQSHRRYRIAYLGRHLSPRVVPGDDPRFRGPAWNRVRKLEVGQAVRNAYRSAGIDEVKRLPDVYTAWELIGFDGTTEVIDRLHDGDLYEQADYEPRPAASVRVRGGRTLYESVGNEGGERVRLARLDASGGTLRAVTRYVDPDTELEVILDD